MSIRRVYWAISLFVETMPKFYYAVRSGRSVGVFDSWDDCKAQVYGCQGARHKKFKTPEEAWEFVNAKQDPNPHFRKYCQSARQSKKETSCTTFPYQSAVSSLSYVPASLSSDYFLSPEPLPVFKPEYTHPMGHSSKRKHEPTPEETYDSSYKKTRHDSTCSASSYGTLPLSVPSSTSSEEKVVGNGRAVVYTDGACESNGRRGARAGVGVYWGDNNPYNTSERLQGRQTNQRAEITAAIRALQTAKARNIKELTLYTDSKYTINAMGDWIHRWKVNGWKTVGNKDVVNKEELETLDSLCQQVNVDWKYVPGHTNIKGNEAADSLARAGARMPSH